jgi:predicted DNA-binding protein with PD1-like motif
MNRLMRRWPHLAIGKLVLAAVLPSCAVHEPVVRWVTPAEAVPHGQAPGATHRLLSTQADGSKTFVLILARGDEVLSALAAFAHDVKVVNASFVAIGAVRDPEVGWFDVTRKEYKAMSLAEQMEVLSLAGDIALAESGQPFVHAHVVLGRSDGSAWGGHLLRATVSPTLEVYVTTYPQPLYRRLDSETRLQLIDPSLTR